MVIRKLILIIACIFMIGFVSACTNPTDAERALRSAGYSDIQIDGYAWFSCGEDDFYHTKFTATNPVGERVSGVVCSGLVFKDATIRF